MSYSDICIKTKFSWVYEGELNDTYKLL